MTQETKNTQDELKDKAREIWLAGLGLFSSAEEEGTKLFNQFLDKGKELMKKGEEIEKKGKEKLNLESTLDDISSFMKDKLNTAFETIGVSTHSEVKDLTEKVDKLTASVAELAEKLEKSK